MEIDGDEVTVTMGPRVYRVLWLEKSTTRGRMQVNVKVSGANVRGKTSAGWRPRSASAADARHRRAKDAWEEGRHGG